MPNITGLQETLNKLNAQSLEIQSFLKSEFQNTGLETLNEAKSKVPVDNNNLRKSSNYEPINEGLGFKVSFSADYAPYVEFGTGGSVLIPKGWEDVAIQFKGKGLRTINLPARPYLIPSFEKNVKLMESRIEAKLINLITI